ncbi:hypothetical protein PENDEC_c022G05187 [Penicillium decumbens]|uniref:Uncharacterized protein n=1 Tax=Penicillium decumbens TaxID=69771 RepID=A0A1V6P0Z1_PENDC|nr:hypothetical protein PENDEC_c022G05187 [Penicillium decumbens]
MSKGHGEVFMPEQQKAELTERVALQKSVTNTSDRPFRRLPNTDQCFAD